jgi:ElaB/YqjD/DUF883 family membrane-anchored ribosome-binding protein
MREINLRDHVDAAIRNVESALQELNNRLDSLPGTGRPGNSLRRARRTLTRKARSLADHVPFERASDVAADTGRVVRQNPVKTVLTAAIAGYCIWSLIHYSTSRTAAGKRWASRDTERNRRLQEDISRGAGLADDESRARH